MGQMSTLDVPDTDLLFFDVVGEDSESPLWHTSTVHMLMSIDLPVE